MKVFDCWQVPVLVAGVFLLHISTTPRMQLAALRKRRMHCIVRYVLECWEAVIVICQLQNPKLATLRAVTLVLKI